MVVAQMLKNGNFFYTIALKVCLLAQSSAMQALAVFLYHPAEISVEDSAWCWDYAIKNGNLNKKKKNINLGKNLGKPLLHM